MITRTIPKILLLDAIAKEGLEQLSSFAEVVDGMNYNRDKLQTEIGSYDGLIVKSGNFINAELIECAGKLKFIGRAGSGLDNIDMQAAQNRNIQVITSPEGNVTSVAEYIICMMMFLSHRLGEAHNGSKRNDFRRHIWQGRNLSNLTVGLVGTGHIGTGVARMVAPLCRRVLANSPHSRSTELNLIDNFSYVESLSDLLAESDIISFQLPLTEQTMHMMDDYRFNQMKPGSILINTSRGGIIDQPSLLRALDNGMISAAALDTLDPDPDYSKGPEKSTYNHYLIHHPSIFYTPHIAAGTSDALREVACNLATKIETYWNEQWR